MHPDDLGHVIGKQGRTARSLRLALGAAAARAGRTATSRSPTDATGASRARVARRLAVSLVGSAASAGRTGCRARWTSTAARSPPLELQAIRTLRLARGRAATQRRSRSRRRAPRDRACSSRFEGITEREQAAELTQRRAVGRARAGCPTPGPASAYTFQLVGLRVETEDGRALGDARRGHLATGGAPGLRGAGRARVAGAGDAGACVQRVDLEAGAHRRGRCRPGSRSCEARREDLAAHHLPGLLPAARSTRG